MDNQTRVLGFEHVHEGYLILNVAESFSLVFLNHLLYLPVFQCLVNFTKIYPSRASHNESI